MGKGDTLLNSVIGAVVTVLTSFLPFSPVIGGAVAGYLQEEDAGGAMRVGAIAGLLSAIPLVFVIVALGSILPFLPAFGTPGNVAGLFGVLFAVVLLFTLVYTVGLSTLGGYLGWYLESESNL
jgi:hypothetical protein